MGIFGRASTKITFKPPESITRMVTGKPSSAPPAGDDDPTLFTTFMVLYYGFFGLSLLFYPYLFAADSSPWNPMVYWTTISAPSAFTFRVAGAGFLTIVLGPFLDDIFGGAGVIMKAFTKQLMITNLAIFVIFLYYTYYAPLTTSVSLMFQVQTALAGVIFGWNVMEANEDKSLIDLYVGFCTMFFGFFSVALATVPDALFGPPSPMAYWKTWDEWGMLTARSLGVTLFVVVLLGYYYYAKLPAFCKLFTAFNVANFGLFIIPAYFGGSSAVSSMWLIQFSMQIPIVLVGLYLEFSGATGPWMCSGPSCGAFLTKETFLTTNAAFILPFAAGFLSPDPNFLFGPASPMPVSMFTVDIDETGLWFCKAWAITTFFLAVSPYMFGLPAVKVVKQITLNYLFTTGLFVFAILQYELFNILVMGPLTGLNVVFFGWGLYLSLPATAGEAML